MAPNTLAPAGARTQVEKLEDPRRRETILEDAVKIPEDAPKNDIMASGNSTRATGAHAQVRLRCTVTVADTLENVRNARVMVRLVTPAGGR